MFAGGSFPAAPVIRRWSNRPDDLGQAQRPREGSRPVTSFEVGWTLVQRGTIRVIIYKTVQLEHESESKWLGRNTGIGPEASLPRRRLDHAG